MSLDVTKQADERLPELTALGKIQSRIDKVKFIIQDKDRAFYNKHCNLFERLEDPRQRFIDTINLKMDDGSIKFVKLFLVQHNLAFGPGKGVLKFIRHVRLPEGVGKLSLQGVRDRVEKLILEEVEASATSMSLHHALYNVKLGGASNAIMLMDIAEIRGEIKTIPIHLTGNETARLSREIGNRLVKYRIMGPDGFWPEPDGVTTDEQIINWVEDEALRTLLLKHLLAPKDKKLMDVLSMVHGQIEGKGEAGRGEMEILETPYHDAALIWLKEWRAIRRGETAMEELNSEESKVSKHYRQMISRTERKYDVMPAIARDIIAVKRLLTVMHLPFRDYRPNGQIVIMDTGIAPVILHGYLSVLEGLSGEDVVVTSVFSKRLGGSSPKRIEQLCRIYVEAAYNLGAKVVILCNTMDANSRIILEKEFTIPILGPIVPAVETVFSLESARGAVIKNIGIIATKSTIESGAYINEIRKHNKEIGIFSVAAPLFATMVDKGKFDKTGSQVISKRDMSIIEANLKPLIEEEIEILILGCTHYGIFKQAIHEIWKSRTGREIQIVDSARELSRYTQAFLRQNKILSLRTKQKGKITYMASEEDTPEFERKVSEITGYMANVVPTDIGEVVGRLSEEDRSFQKTVVKESREDINLRAGIIDSNLSAEAKVAIADKLYGVKDKSVSRTGCEVLSPELKDEHIKEITGLTTQNEELLNILSRIKNTTSR
ncbi:MAG: Glutamate racemase [Candidatus Scalindua arabica]|uniref:Glutamate racemase n=1 Tax=Candidatus Scalindua arabica TaxID=1127984 RepID=A0A941ZZA3_9BACT|nr:Glutamate racemase [Candidatus Scalindua arabica]